jgi:two-component system nitrate/nitrite sensor histidine kinase NarQ
VHLLQIVREAVLNAIKHAQASEITVSCVTSTDGTHSVNIRDNGIGIEASEPPDTGLNIMREQAGWAAPCTFLSRRMAEPGMHIQNADEPCG